MTTLIIVGVSFVCFENLVFGSQCSDPFYMVRLGVELQTRANDFDEINRVVVVVVVVDGGAMGCGCKAHCRPWSTVERGVGEVGRVVGAGRR